MVFIYLLSCVSACNKITLLSDCQINVMQDEFDYLATKTRAKEIECEGGGGIRARETE